MAPDSPMSASMNVTARANDLFAFLEKAQPYAVAADAVARRIGAKVKAVALLGTLSAAWLSYACYTSFNLSWGALAAIAVMLFAAPFLLWRANKMLSEVIGLPSRITETANRASGTLGEYSKHFGDRSQANVVSKPTLRSLWSIGKSLVEVKSLSDEARQVAAVLGSALAVANPVFIAVLTLASIASGLIAVIAAVVGLAYLF